MRIPKVAAGIILTLLVSPSAWPWSRIGHSVVARLAWEQLTPAARSAVLDLLGPDESFPDASTWADERRNGSSGP